MLLGDFNFIRSQDNRNKPGGDVNEMFLFNDIIGHLGLLELPLKGRRYTWSNMQREPLLDQLDLFFTSQHWISDYPNSMVLPLAKKDLIMFLVWLILTHLYLRQRFFRFENYWVDLPGFTDCVTQSWERGSAKLYSSAIIADKLKGLRQELKKWHMSLARLKLLIQNCNKVLLILDTLEEERPLFRAEFNFRLIVKLHLEELLLAECNYWKKRCTIRWIKQGEDNTKKFHAMATERFRRNTIAMLHDSDGNEVSDHHAMASLLWAEYKNRMGRSDGIKMELNLHSLIKRVDGLEELTALFWKRRWMM
jgi:hypothetical protein